MGDIFVIFFFGIIAVGGTFYVQAGFLSQEVILLGLACGLVVNNILVVNNYRDADDDILANKRTLVVLLGRRWALVQYGLSLFVAGVTLIWLVWQGSSPMILLGWLAIAYGFQLLTKLAKANTRADFMAALKGAALVVVLYSILVSMAFFY